MSTTVRFDLSAVEAEVVKWFFDDYLMTWVNAGAGLSQDTSSFISNYWGHPLHVCSDAVQEHKLQADDVVLFLDQMHKRLKGSGYRSTKVLDRRVKVYNRRGAGIEVIWSRRREDGSEIERIAVHFEVSKLESTWRVASIQSTHTTAETLDGAWSELNLGVL
ncbi:DUF6841 family protein [Variovorax arabinosiphilus]|uniref:DUF6841 family protein n=1 Tax=Variovorax arabinosiphilus TaxID=3053498 RepID=UPI00257643B9|nr:MULTISPECIES: hypothetical protein [unclassified Variovorax]MDM0118375.1 hypothetical protein [Variovorax sp. J2L1-78]MDM0128800.1 hypothetical protein [Variovorax sp. J2L1-63]MDM0233414.1 hypothetical protein [Variovorax sp. J2R1-6]